MDEHWRMTATSLYLVAYRFPSVDAVAHVLRNHVAAIVVYRYRYLVAKC